jgi:hypothetical protein
MRSRRTVKTEHHALLGSRFLTHPPICKIHVEVKATDSPGSTQIRLTADYGSRKSDAFITWLRSTIGWGVSACSRERTTPPQM